MTVKGAKGKARYPFTVPVIASLERIEFRRRVTFFAGGNGTGKSSLLEAIALATNRISVSASGSVAVPPGIRELAKCLRFEWLRPGPGVEKGLAGSRHRGFFLRAEDFLDYKRGLSTQIAELRRTAEDFDNRFTGYGRDLARGAALGQAKALTDRYGEDLDAMSHGESFLQFFRARFTGPGLYVLDEPDTALSPQSVLGLMAALDEMSAEGAQFIVATHNPILLSYPNATVLSFDQSPVRECSWEELEQVGLLRDFLANPRVFLRHLGVDG